MRTLIVATAFSLAIGSAFAQLTEPVAPPTDARTAPDTAAPAPADPATQTDHIEPITPPADNQTPLPRSTQPANPAIKTTPGK